MWYPLTVLNWSSILSLHHTQHVPLNLRDPAKPKLFANCSNSKYPCPFSTKASTNAYHFAVITQPQVPWSLDSIHAGTQACSHFVTQRQSGTSAAKIVPRSWLQSILQIHYPSSPRRKEDRCMPQDLTEKIRMTQQAHKERVTITFGRPHMSLMISEGIPQSHSDQLNVIAHHLLHAIHTCKNINGTRKRI